MSAHSVHSHLELTLGGYVTWPLPVAYEEARLSALSHYLRGDVNQLKDWHIQLADALASRELSRRKIDGALAYARLHPEKV